MVVLQFNWKKVPETSTKPQGSNMKFALAIVLVLATATPLYADLFKLPSSRSGALARELQDFMDLIPVQEIISLTKTYYQNDREFQLLMGFMRTPELKQYIQDVFSAPQTKELLNYVQKQGLNIYGIVNKIQYLLNLAPIAPSDESEFRITGGIRGYVTDVGALLPTKKLYTLLKNKMSDSKVFIDFINFVSQPRYLDFYASLHKNKNYLKLKQKVVQAGLSGEDFDFYSGIYIGVSFIVL